MTSTAPSTALAGLATALDERLTADGVAVLSPLDATDALVLVAAMRLAPRCVMLDPWYNRGVGGVVGDREYGAHIEALLAGAGAVGEHVYLWGFPEIVSRFVDRLPEPLALVAWLTWYYKNNPSVIRGWRSAQMACLHVSRPAARLYPEHFMNEAQLARQAAGKLRYLPGPPSVIEEPLLVGFVGRAEQTGHPAQKPVAVYDRLVRMVSVAGDLVVDPLCGSGTTGAACRALGRRALLSDQSEEYTAMVEDRLSIRRIEVPAEAVEAIAASRVTAR